MAVSFGLMVVSKKELLKQWGQVIMGLGLLFLGLYLMEETVEPLKKRPSVKEWMTHLANPIRGALVGAGATVVLQSSSATVGMAVVLAGEKLLTLPAGIALMMGAELGTCADTLLASVGRSRAALRTGLFHLVFNVLSIAVGLTLIEPFTDLVLWLSGRAGVGRQLANAHVLFNVIGVCLVAGLVPLLSTWLDKWLPDLPHSVSQPVS